MRKQLIAGAAALALVAFGSSAANATTVNDGDDVEIGDVTWEDVYPTDSSDENFYIDDLYTDDSGDIFDSIGFAQFYLGGDVDNWFNLYCDTADIEDATDGSGDKIITCGPIDLDTNVSASIEARLYAEGDMVRFVQTLTNDTDAAIDYDWWAWGGYGDAFGGTNNAGWEVEEGEDNGEWVGAAWGLETADKFPNVVEDSDDSYGVSGFDGSDVDGVHTYSLAAGESVSFATFVFHNAPNSDLYPSNDFESLEAWAADTFDAFDGRLVAGLADGTVVANWGTANTESDSNDLADTGINSLGLIGLASALVAASAIVAVRRRKA